MSEIFHSAQCGSTWTRQRLNRSSRVFCLLFTVVGSHSLKTSLTKRWPDALSRYSPRFTWAVIESAKFLASNLRAKDLLTCLPFASFHRTDHLFPSPCRLVFPPCLVNQRSWTIGLPVVRVKVGIVRSSRRLAFVLSDGVELTLQFVCGRLKLFNFLCCAHKLF